MSNCISFVGRVGRDAELKDVGGNKVLSFSLANDVGFGDKKKTNWMNCNLWGKQGESVARFVTKGKQVWVSGELSTRDYQGKDGTNKTSLEVRVNQLDLVGGKSDSTESAQEHKQDNPSSMAPTPESAESMPF